MQLFYLKLKTPLRVVHKPNNKSAINNYRNEHMNALFSPCLRTLRVICQHRSSPGLNNRKEPPFYFFKLKETAEMESGQILRLL